MYAWQLIQVDHITPRPIILLGDMWNGLINWMKDEPLKRSLINEADFDNITTVQNINEVIPILEPHIKKFYNSK